MILFEKVAPGDFYTRIGMIIVGGLIFLQGVRIRCSNPPKFVANYRGWSSPDLSQLRLGWCLWIVLVLVRAFWVCRVGH